MVRARDRRSRRSRSSASLPANGEHIFQKHNFLAIREGKIQELNNTILNGLNSQMDCKFLSTPKYVYKSLYHHGGP